MSELNSLRPKLTDYSDYHAYLRDFYEFKKCQNKNFSFRKFAQLANIKSSNYLMLVMNRRRNLLPDTARDVARAMKLSKNETDFFVALVKMERAKNPEDRDLVEKNKKVAFKKIFSKDLPADKAEYLSVWYYSLVRELAFLPDFQPNPPWIAKKLNNLISEKQAEAAVRTLVNLGIWKKFRNKIQVAEVFLDTGAEERGYTDVNVTSIHRQNLVAWSKIIESIPKSERELGLINIPINAEKIPELKSRIQLFQDEIIGWLQDEKEPTQIVQLGTYLVPMTTEVNVK